MGDPKFPRKKYERPSHPWEADRIKVERELVKKYGLKNKKEVWIAQSFLRNVRSQARALMARLRYGDKQAEKEAKDLIGKLYRYGVLPDNATLDDVLSLDVNDVLKRRLQTVVYMKGLASSKRQARQFIVHGHIAIRGRRVTVPGYLVRRDEEDDIDYAYTSPLADEEHPARPKLDVLQEVLKKKKAGGTIGGGA
ncbi:MAG: 30S ribosomal protein S4 [Thermoplasmata archaeon]|nr:MAG: 30S ribosomal protein S4 [Thermoplasmata archaeon]